MLNSTNKLFIFPELNKRFGFNLVSSYFNNDYVHYINLEIIGDELYGKFQINIDIYDDEGNFKMPISKTSIDGKTFDGITAQQIRLSNKHLEALENCHIRIYPTNTYLESKLYNSMTLVQVGLNFGNRREFIDKLKIGDSVTLELDSYNKFDKFAVKVLDSKENHIGFLSSDCAFIYNQHSKDNKIKTATILKINKSTIYLKSPILFSSKNEFLFGE